MKALSSPLRVVRRGRIELAFRVVLAVLIPIQASLAEDPERPSVEIGWTANPPVLDGLLEPSEWAEAAHVDGLTQATPDPGQPATQHTEIWIMTDEDNLYIAARLWDTDPDQIVAFAMRRDGDTLRDDRFGFTIDPFLDRQNGYFFQVNPNGARRDALIEGGSFETSWDGRWYARTSRDEEGWTVEIALPYASINFDPAGDVWGLNMARGIRRRNEIDRWADPVRERFLLNMARAGNLIGMRGIRQGLGLSVTPAATLRRVDDANQLDDEDEERHYTRFDPSLDAFYKVLPSVTGSVTVNTDFGETEVDERRVNLDRFELFFPEKRDFFLQDALIFDFGDLERNGRPFFSRRIGIDSEGDQRGILAGGKVTGRVGPVKFGVLSVGLDERRDVDAQNQLVARAALNLGESTLGAILTNGDPLTNGDNTVIGADFIYRNSNFLDDKTFRASLFFQSSFSDPDDDEDPDSDEIDGSGLAYGGAISYPNDRHNWALSARIFEDQFDPALGFANRVGIRDYRAEYRLRFRPDASLFQTVDTKVDGRLVTGFSSNVETGRFTWTAVDARTPFGDAFRLQYIHRYEFVQEAFENLEVGVGRYHFDEAELRLTASPNRPVRGTLVVGYGDFFDGTRARVNPDLTIRFSRFVQLGLDYRLDDIRLPDGDELIHLFRGRVSFFFTPDLSWVTLVQFDNVSDSIGVNSRFRWIIEDGRELFLVLNQGLDTRDGVEARRTAPLAKLEWTFRF